MRVPAKFLVSAMLLVVVVFVSQTSFALPALSKLTVNNSLSSLTSSGEFFVADLSATPIPFIEQSAGSLIASQTGEIQAVIDPDPNSPFITFTTSQILSDEDHVASPGFFIDPNLSFPENHVSDTSATSAIAAWGIDISFGAIFGGIYAAFREVDFALEGSSAITGTSIASETLELTPTFSYLDFHGYGPIGGTLGDPATSIFEDEDPAPNEDSGGTITFSPLGDGQMVTLTVPINVTYISILDEQDPNDPNDDDYVAFDFDGTIVAEGVYLEGDVNGDGLVNGLDANIISGNFLLSPATTPEGDINGDGVVNGLDANVLSANFLNSAPATAIPEPTGLTLAALCFGPLLFRRRRKSAA